MRQMRNSSHDIQMWSKDPMKPPLYKEDHTKGMYSLITANLISETKAQILGQTNPKSIIWKTKTHQTKSHYGCFARIMNKTRQK